jgi:pimeloyl-ACP methyl ester carboxylesterase
VKASKFEVHIPDQTLDDMRNRIRAARWPHVIGEDDWQYGPPQAWLKDICTYWADEFDWRGVEKKINRYDHYKTEVDGIPIHFIHKPGKGPNPTPLILTHGWPWSFWDFKDVIDPLADPAAHGGDPADAFDVIVPSLPGFGFSTPLTKSGVGVDTVADLWVRLMQDVCGYGRFAAHGGDWGALITGQLSHAHADKLLGAHLGLTLIPGVGLQTLTAEDHADDEQWMIERRAEAMPLITSHVAVHAADPQTLSYAFMDSPVGMAAWIWQRRRNWSDCNGDVETAFTRDHLCALATLYWCTGAITSSLRIYTEHFNAPWPLKHDRSPVMEAPTGFAIFPKDVVHVPRGVVEKHVNLKHWTVMPRGGHFGAAEAPDLLVDDVRAFFRKLK